MTKGFLPVSRQEMFERGWQQLDFVFVSGDAYVDHPSFAPAVICRVLESKGYKVGLICQPNWRDKNDFKLLGRPRLGFLVAAGNLDSMLNHYTAAKKERRQDAYSPGGEAGKRPDRATIVYSNRIREAYKKTPIIIGGVEASLRRFTHYDYWDNKLRRSVLMDSKADMLIYGMGERAIVEVADYLAGGIPIEEIRHVRGTAYMADSIQHLEGVEQVHIATHEQLLTDKVLFAKSFKQQYDEQDPIRGRIVVQKCADTYIVQNPPQMPLDSAELDEIYDLPYMRNWHPSYDALGGVPAIEEVKFSIVSQRGCFGSCSFCAIHSHQGRIIQARSHESIVKEAQALIKMPDFKGYIHDVGGPTANFRHPSCKKQLTKGTCKDRQCLFPHPCKQLDTSHDDYIELLKKLRALPGIKKVFIRSGVRYDYLLLEKSGVFLHELCANHVSGQLKVAPEHVVDSVLACMQKPGKDVYLQFADKFAKKNAALGLKQYLVPYLISSHPGASLNDAVSMAEFLRDIGHQPEQVQDFIPTPGSLSTAMYYAEYNPLNGQAVFVAKTAQEKAMQRALLQYKNPKNRQLVIQALQKANRQDLIGNSAKCLIKTRDAERRERRHGAADTVDAPVKHSTEASRGSRGKSSRAVNKQEARTNTFKKKRK